MSGPMLQTRQCIDIPSRSLMVLNAKATIGKYMEGGLYKVVPNFLLSFLLSFFVKRLCIDYRVINSLLPKVNEAHSKAKGVLTLVPLPKIDEIYA